MNENEPRHEVIVVDEQDGLRWLYQHWLEADGYRVRAVKERGELEIALLNASPDLILLDLHLGGLDGIRICRDLKNDEGTRHIPVIGTTSEAGGMSKRLAQNAGADGVLAKPFSRIELELEVQAHLTQAGVAAAGSHKVAAGADPDAIDRQ